jgi:hypothetical protein
LTDHEQVTEWTNFQATAELSALLGSSRAKLISMDTYYYGTGRVLDALDFYATRVSPEHFSVGLSSFSSRPPTGDFIARFHALRMYRIKEVTMFAMPTEETWMPWLRKWKTDCAGCPGGGALSCWANSSCY